MRYLSLIAVLVAALALSAASGGRLVWGDSAPGHATDTVVWGN